MRIYTYEKCSTCRKALQWLAARGITPEVLPIKEVQPTTEELDLMLEAKGGDLRKLFNTSGMDYREKGFKEKMPTLAKAAAFDYLQGNGMLVKRPFLISEDQALVGFREKEWEQAFTPNPEG